MYTRIRITPVVLTATLGVGGCMVDFAPPVNGEAALAPLVAAKATDVAGGIGGAGGFGGALMEGYFEHMPGQMGFRGADDLASAAGGITVRLRNESDEDGTFHISYFASHMGLDDLMRDVDVSAGGEVTLELPCAEIVGLGPLDIPGEAGCHLAGGEAIDNTMAVPGFLGTDYECGEVIEYLLTPDVDDFDGDGDTEELILRSDAMDLHMTEGGPTGHLHGDDFGMMGSHMGG